MSAQRPADTRTAEKRVDVLTGFGGTSAGRLSGTTLRQRPLSRLRARDDTMSSAASFYSTITEPTIPANSCGTQRYSCVPVVSKVWTYT